MVKFLPLPLFLWVISSAFAAGPERLIVALGDSTTAGTPGFISPREAPPEGSGNKESQYAYWIMRKHPDWKVVNQGINGQRSDQLLARFDEDVARLHPRDVIVLAGVNDLFQGRDADSVIKNLKALYAKAKAQKISVVACSVLPYDGMPAATRSEWRKLNDWIAQNSKQQNFIFCDTARLLEDPARPGNLISSPDGYHPDVAGYRKMGELIAESLGS